MYQSRLHATNGLVSVALDTLSGEILELVKENSWDNVIKSNCHPKAWMPFVLECVIDGKTVKGRPARYEERCKDASLNAKVEIIQNEKSAIVKVDYPAAVFGDVILPIKTHVEIELPENDVRMKWNITVQPDGEHELERVMFPAISGVWLGDTWEDDILMVPANAGIRIVNPVKTLAEPAKTINWKWQEYRYTYSINGCGSAKDERDSYVREYIYSGPASMCYMDLYDEGENTGLYITCRDHDLRNVSIRTEAFGEINPGLGLSIVHNAFTNETFKSQECVIALHDGDWHWAADEYREYRKSIVTTTARKHRPDWFMKSTGLVAHYDFKYQTHGVVHKYKDIPEIFEQAKAMGMNHLLISGWNYDGFDHGFPEYRVDPELGTEEEFRNAIHKVREMGGHVAFYINSRLCNVKYENRAKLIKESTIMRKDGSMKIENYGARDLNFAILCNQSPEWRDEFVGVVDYLTNNIGADSMYLDQLAMAGGELCFHPGHKEHEGKPYYWNHGYMKMLEQMRNTYTDDGVAMLYEGVSDIYGWGVSGQLISTMFNPLSAPEMYKYTFPDEVLVDMMNARRNSGMRAEHVARKSTMLLYRAFVCGSYFWVYDLEMDNTFRRDPDQYERLKHILALRSAWINTYGHGTFKDNVGIKNASAGIVAKKYEIENGLLVAVSNEHRQEAYFDVEVANESVCAFVRTYNDPDTEKQVAISFKKINGKTYAHIELDAEEELDVVIIKEA